MPRHQNMPKNMPKNIPKNKESVWASFKLGCCCAFFIIIAVVVIYVIFIAERPEHLIFGTTKTTDVKFRSSKSFKCHEHKGDYEKLACEVDTLCDDYTNSDLANKNITKNAYLFGCRGQEECDYRTPTARPDGVLRSIKHMLENKTCHCGCKDVPDVDDPGNGYVFDEDFLLFTKEKR